ncbi:MAG: DUF983 domain-containing protein [Ktedonobacteraceae bacterium]|nr:DUF983 domain-containing protein [Ktedonobacteraceae bacterium]
MGRGWILLERGLLLRCPVCGKGKLFRNLFTMYDQCPVCHFVYEREEGYFSSAMAINLIITELLVAAIVIPLGVVAGTTPNFPIVPVLIMGGLLAILLPLLFYRHSRGLWMSMDHWLNPPLR